MCVCVCVTIVTGDEGYQIQTKNYRDERANVWRGPSKDPRCWQRLTTTTMTKMTMMARGLSKTQAEDLIIKGILS